MTELEVPQASEDAMNAAPWKHTHDDIRKIAAPVTAAYLRRLADDMALPWDAAVLRRHADLIEFNGGAK
jgi:hypothetical protein